MAAEPIEIDITRSIRPLRAKLTLAKRSSAVPTMASGTMPKNRITDALTMGLKWREETTASGPKPEDVGDHLTDWLDTLKEL